MTDLESLKKIVWQRINNLVNNPKPKNWIFSKQNDSDLYLLDKEDWHWLHGYHCPANFIPGFWPHRGEKLSWFPSDDEKRFNENQDWMEQNGWTKESVYYNTNKQGFRDFSIETDVTSETGGAIYLGCSCTFGTGVNLEQTFSWLAHQQYLSHMRYLNFGMPGAGLDTYYRVLKSYFDIVKPELVVVSHPWAVSRSEKFDTQSSKWESLNVRSTSIDPAEYFCNEASVLRFHKNLDAIQWMCHKAGCKFILFDVLSTDNQNKFVDYARDMEHPGPKQHTIWSNKLLELMHETL